MRVPSTPDLTAQVFRDARDLQRMRNLWASLAAAAPAAVTPWQQSEFIESWWNGVGRIRSHDSRRKLCLILVSQNGEPRLLLPLQISKASRFGMRWLEPLGMPDDIHRPRFAIGPLQEDLYACALRAIHALRSEWDGLRIDEKSADDPELVLLQRLAQPYRWTFRSVPLHPCPYLDLQISWPEYLAGRSHKLRKNLSAGRRRLEATGPLRLQYFESPADLRSGFELLLAVTARSWKHAAGIGLGSSEQYRAFYREFLGRMADAQRARIYCLYAGDRPVAATLAFIDGTTYYSTQIAHDADFDHCSPGTLLESMEMQSLLSEGRFKTFDFLGAALSNKRRWTDTMHDTQRIVWLASTTRAWAFDSYFFRLKPRLLAARRQLRPQSTTLERTPDSAL